MRGGKWVSISLLRENKKTKLNSGVDDVFGGDVATALRRPAPRRDLGDFGDLGDGSNTRYLRLTNRAATAAAQLRSCVQYQNIPVKAQHHILKFMLKINVLYRTIF